jgi:hypothetical protein
VDPSFNALIAPFNEPIVTVKVEKIEAPVDDIAVAVKVEKIKRVVKEKVVKVMKVEDVEPPPIVRQKAERERPTPPMVPLVALPQEWMKSLCEEEAVEEIVEPVTPLFTPSDVSIPLLVAVLCTGYAAWRVSRSFTADAPAAPAVVPEVSM